MGTQGAVCEREALTHGGGAAILGTGASASARELAARCSLQIAEHQKPQCRDEHRRFVHTRTTDEQHRSVDEVTSFHEAMTRRARIHR